MELTGMKKNSNRGEEWGKRSSQQIHTAKEGISELEKKGQWK